MKNLKTIKMLSIILITMIVITSITSKTVSANTYTISGTWAKGQYKLYVNDKEMTMSLRNIKEYKSGYWCDGFEPSDVDKNVYWISLHDKTYSTSGYFEVHVKGKKMKLKWSGGDKEYKCFKGTWKRKNKKWTEKLDLSKFSN